MNIKSFISKNIFYKYYMNIGANKISVNRNNSFFILGYYFSSSVINISRILLQLKNKFAFVVNYFIKNKLITIFNVNIISNKFLYKIYRRACRKRRISYFFGTWWNGFLRNFKYFVKHKGRKKHKCKVYRSRFPSFVFYISNQKYFKKDVSSNTFYSEVNTACIPNIVFCNTDSNSYRMPSSVFENTRNIVNNLFLQNLAFSVCKKCAFISKKKYCFFIFKKWKTFSLNKYVRLPFFEYLFFAKKKLNFLKYAKWSDDLR